MSHTDKTKPTNKGKPAKKNYNWPPPIAPEDAYVPRDRNPIHSILTALPVIMLLVGLYIYYNGEAAQSQGVPIRAQSIDVQGVFTGLSVVNAGGSQGRHYLWFDEQGKARGVRVQPSQATELETLVRGEPLVLKIAPTVDGSKTYWAWYVEQGGVVFLDASAALLD